MYFVDEVNWSKKSNDEVEDCGDEAEAIDESNDNEEDLEESDGDDVEEPNIRGGVCSKDSYDSEPMFVSSSSCNFSRSDFLRGPEGFCDCFAD